MSQAESQSDSGDVQSGETSSGIVITNGPNGLGDGDSDPGSEAEPDAEAETEAEAEPAVDDGSETEDEVTPDAGVDGEDESAEEETPNDESEEEQATGSEVEANSQVDTASEPDIEEDGDAGDDDGTTTETDTQVDAEEENEEDEASSDSGSSAHGVADEVADSANTNENSNDSNDSNTNMSESETEANNQSTDTGSGSGELADVSGAPDQFEATIKADALQGLIDSVDVLVDECKIRLGENRVGIRAVDPANVGMVDVELEAEAFESYHTSPGLLGLNLERFADVVSLGDRDDLVHLDYNPQTRKLTITVDGVEYTLALIDPDSIRQEPDIPDLDLPVEVAVESSVIDQGVTASDMVSDHIALGTQQDGRVNQLVIEAEGDTDDVELVKGEDEDEVVDGTFNGTAHSLFSLDYLKDMNKALPNNGVVTLELGEEFPVKIHFDDEDEQMHTSYMLAPRIQSD
jgi:proliferating cell nuclear antigen